MVNTITTETVTHHVLIEQQILTQRHQSLLTIPEGDEVIIDYPDDAKILFNQHKTKDGDVVTLFH